MDNINEEFFNFIGENMREEPEKVLFRYHDKPLPFSIQFAVLQLECRKKYRNKLPSFLNNSQFLFPDSLAAEQASDERVARYHAALVGRDRKILDMTAGLGIDALIMAENGNGVRAIELIPHKEEVLRFNANALGIKSFDCCCGDSVQFISETIDKFDIVFIDPARRRNDSSRAYSFGDCTPDILSIIDKIYKVSPKVMIKASPLLDINHILNEIPTTENIHIVCVKGECKEILIEAGKNGNFNEVTIVDLKSDGRHREITFSKDELEDTKPPIAKADMLRNGMYLYEPVSGLMKITAYGALCKRFGLYKLSGSTSLYLSDRLEPAFPGRISKVETIADKKILSSLRGEKYNVVSRNYPLSADSLRIKYKLKEGRDKFIYAFRFGVKEVPVIVLSSHVQ